MEEGRITAVDGENIGPIVTSETAKMQKKVMLMLNANAKR